MSECVSETSVTGTLRHAFVCGSGNVSNICRFFFSSAKQSRKSRVSVGLLGTKCDHNTIDRNVVDTRPFIPDHSVEPIAKRSCKLR